MCRIRRCKAAMGPRSTLCSAGWAGDDAGRPQQKPLRCFALLTAAHEPPSALRTAPSTEDSPFTFCSGPAVGRGAAGACWHLTLRSAHADFPKPRPGFDSRRLSCCFCYPLTLFAKPSFFMPSPVTLDTHHRLSSMDHAEGQSLNVKLVYA